MTVLLNFDFIKNDLVNNTINYLNENEKGFLLKEGEQWGFNGTGFKNKTKLYEYMVERGFIYKRN